MLRRNIAATSLKMLMKNLYSVKCYDKFNMNVLTLSLWENFWWGLIYFDQFTTDIYQIQFQTSTSPISIMFIQFLFCRELTILLLKSKFILQKNYHKLTEITQWLRIVFLTVEWSTCAPEASGSSNTCFL